MKCKTEYFYDNNLRRQLVCDAEDISQIYFNLGVLLEKLISSPISELSHRCLTIRFYL